MKKLLLLCIVATALFVFPLSAFADFEIVTAPVDCEVAENSMAMFTVEATEAASYLWQYSYNNGKSWATQPNGTDKTLYVEAKSFRFNYLFRCVVKNSRGDELITNTVKLVKKEEESKGGVVISGGGLIPDPYTFKILSFNHFKRILPLWLDVFSKHQGFVSCHPDQ